MIFVLNGTPGCSKTWACKQLKYIANVVDENPHIVNQLLAIPNIIDMQYGFIDLWLQMMTRAIDMWTADPNKDIIFVGSMFYRTSVFWYTLKRKKPYDIWVHMDRIISVLIMLEAYILLAMGVVLNITIEIPVQKNLKKFT